MAYAKSMTVEPIGRLITSPFGVKTNTSSGARSVLMERTRSVISSLSDWLSSMLRIHCKRPSSESGFSLPLVMPSLYFQCAAMPYSAVWCISHVRICTSNGMPSLLMTVVCKDWYMFCFGVEM